MSFSWDLLRHVTKQKRRLLESLKWEIKRPRTAARISVFEDLDAIAPWEVITDSIYDGKSVGKFEYDPKWKAVKFSGNLDFKTKDYRVDRLGFASIRLQADFDGLGHFDHFLIRVRSSMPKTRNLTFNVYRPKSQDVLNRPIIHQLGFDIPAYAPSTLGPSSKPQEVEHDSPLMRSVIPTVEKAATSPWQKYWYKNGDWLDVLVPYSEFKATVNGMPMETSSKGLTNTNDWLNKVDCLGWIMMDEPGPFSMHIHSVNVVSKREIVRRYGRWERMLASHCVDTEAVPLEDIGINFRA
eukprot:TRINITY_DN8201_c0_g1::TRINITY_DN8201_c0_g1_i1::g.7241::m.7241 TRINITY_DN8201_c0_g1::TRINITY_DN8201_c0_g1_i1::g.7241  ORF type:complete len:323 (+),score=23.64,CIA30/PF08547.7/7.8e-11 TRINITY_DN8201_c0_g1_i1:83-970(+)